MAGTAGDGGGEEHVMRFEAPPDMPLTPIPELNYASFMLDMLANHGNTPAMVDTETEEQRTYAELCTLVPRASGGLRGAGVMPGDVVLMVMPNHVDYPLVLLAIQHCGATAAPTSPLLKPKELAHVAQVSKARHVVAHRTVAQGVRKAFKLLPQNTLKKLWVIGSVGEDTTWERLLHANPIPAYTMNDGLVPSKSVAMLLFSSGTTGFPKGVMLSHRTLVTAHTRSSYMVALQGEMGVDPLTYYRSVLVVVPQSHMYGHGMVVLTLAVGGTVFTMPKFSPQNYFAAIEKFKITLAPMVPHMARYFIEGDLRHRYDTSSLFVLTSASAPLAANTASELMNETGRIVTGAYGLTETYGAMTSSNTVNDNLASVGKVLPYSEIKVVDASGKALRPGMEGEVCTRGPMIMLGYINNPDATAAALDSDGWFYTGDIGYFDENKSLYITDRLKDLIKVKGFQVAPTELESVLLTHPDVADVAVVGVPHSGTGEAPRAFVVPRSATIDTGLLEDFVAERVSHYKRLTGGIRVVDAIPRNPNGKILRRQLREASLKPSSKL